MEVTMTTIPLEAHLVLVKSSECHALTTARWVDLLSTHWNNVWTCRGGKVRRSRQHYMAAIVEEDPDWVVTRVIGNPLMRIHDPIMVVMIRIEMVKVGSSRTPGNLASITFILYMPQSETES